MLFTFIPIVVGFMLIGMWTARRGIWSNPAAHKKLLYWACGIGFGVGVPWHLFTNLTATIETPYIAVLLQGFGAPPLAVGYISAFLLLYQLSLFRKVTAGLRAVGRMALTNYLSQSVVFGTLFMSYGLGLFGQYNYAALFGIVIVAWIVQIVFSILWLKFFRMGPVEWIWRTLAYGKVQPFLRRAEG